MRILAFFTLLLSTLNVNAQTEIGFTTSNQILRLSDTTTVISLFLDLKGVDSYTGTSNLNLELTSSFDDKTYLFGVTKNNGFDIILSPTANRIVSFNIPINNKLLKTQETISFKLQKKDLNNNFQIFRSEHTVLVIPEKTSKKVANLEIHFPEGSDGILKIDYKNDDIVTIPFIIQAIGYIPSPDDKIEAKILLEDFKEVSSFLPWFQVKGEKNFYELKFKKSEAKFEFQPFLDQLVNKDRLKIVLSEVKKQSNSEILINKKQDHLFYFLKYQNKPQNRYSFYLGTNFDLKDRFEATSFYSEIEAWMPEVFNTLGFRVGIYKNNFSVTTVEQSFESRTRIMETVRLQGQTEDSITYIRSRVNQTPLASVENLGLYGEINEKLYQSNNFRFFLAAHFEIIERRETFRMDNENILTIETKTISLDELRENEELQIELSRPDVYRRKYFDSYVGIGAPMLFWNNSENFEIFLNPVLGVGNSGLQLYNPDGNLIGKNPKVFWLCQFSLVENNFGLKISGEIREYWSKYINQPFISINISKKFSLKNLLDPS